MRLLSIIFTGICLLFCIPILAQDKIIDLNGEERLVTITEITPDSVSYKEVSDSVNQKIHAIHKQQLFMVTFKNGNKEIFLDKTLQTAVQSPLSNKEYSQLGQLDARRHFKSRGAFWGTFGATFVPFIFPFGGVATGAAVSLSDPDERNVITSNPEYKKNLDYMLGYNKQAKKKKLASAAGGFGAALGTYFIVISAVFAGVL